MVPSMQGDSCCRQSLVRGFQARNLAPGVSRKTKHILRLPGALARRIRLTRDWNITCSLPASRSAPSSSKHPKLEWNISPVHAPAVHADGSHTEVGLTADNLAETDALLCAWRAMNEYVRIDLQRRATASATTTLEMALEARVMSKL